MGLPIEYRPMALFCKNFEVETSGNNSESTSIVALDLTQRKLDSLVANYGNLCSFPNM